MMGILCFYDIIVGDDVPVVRDLGNQHPVYEISSKNTTKHLYLAKVVNPDEFWEGMQPTLDILETVLPEAADWARTQHKNNLVEFEYGINGYYARFDNITTRLILNKSMLNLNDREKASIIAHEFRHSRQNFFKFVKYVLSYALTRELHVEIIETDSYYYEEEVKAALKGREFATWNEYEY